MKNTGRIYAFDLDQRRLQTLKRLTTKAGCRSKLLSFFLKNKNSEM